MSTWLSELDKKSIGTLYAQSHLWLRRWLYLKVGCNQMAADLVQDTFERLIKRPDDNDIKDSDAYLKTIARRLLIDHWRKQEIEQAYQQALLLYEDEVFPSAEEQAEHLQLLIQLDKHLHQLTPVVRQTFIYAQLEGLSYQDIADKLDISISTVKRHLKQAMLSCCFNLAD